MSRLDPMMPCDTAFRIVARRYLGEMAAHHQAACKGDPEAVHQMRVALTHLRAALLFFRPMIVDSEQIRIKGEVKWLNGHLGAARDLDVAIQRLEATAKSQTRAVSDYQPWYVSRAENHRRLARELRSTRYRRLVKTTSDWIESGPWSIRKGKQAKKQRACPIATYAASKLARWQRKVLKRSRKLPKMSAEKRHRLRLLNKRLSYSTEFFEDLNSDKRISEQLAALKYLRKAQRALGQLNDDANSHSLSATLLQQGAPAPLPLLGPKREKRLLRTAVAAYRKLAARQP